MRCVEEGSDSRLSRKQGPEATSDEIRSIGLAGLGKSSRGVSLELGVAQAREFEDPGLVIEGAHCRLQWWVFLWDSTGVS